MPPMQWNISTATVSYNGVGGADLTNRSLLAANLERPKIGLNQILLVIDIIRQKKCIECLELQNHCLPSIFSTIDRKD